MKTIDRLADDAALEAWFDSAPNREKTNAYDDLKTGPVRRITEVLGIDRRPITIAGTKGKGSTLRFLEQILLAHGDSCVAFTSPHISKLRERWRLDGEPASLAVCASACRRVAAAEADCGLHLTYFERCFAVACVLAQDRPLAHFLCEVGLGGRLDCANVLDTSLAICCSLSRDHCHILGDTLEEIAFEKLAIARADAPLLIAPQSKAAQQAIEGQVPSARHVTWITDDILPGGWSLGLAGPHQRDNAATALSASRNLLEERFEAAVACTALARTTLNGRCQVLDWQGHRLLIDGAHNGASMAATIATAQQHLPPDWILILGLAGDKLVDEILDEIPQGQTIWRCDYASDRCLRANDWPEALQQAPSFATIEEALQNLNANQSACVSGSLYLAGEALAVVGAVGPG